MDIEIKDGGTYRIYPTRLQGVALNAYGSSATTSGQNVCLYKDTPSDTMQDWIIRAVDLYEGSYQIHSANNTDFVLDRSNGALRTSRNNNAHLCKLRGTNLNDSEVMITTPAGDSQGHVFIKLKAAINGQVLYLTSTNYSSSDSTPSSITSSMALNTNGNVYWAPQSSATRAYQYWRLEKQGDSGETIPPEPEPQPGEGFGNGTIAVGKRPSTLDYSRACYGPTFNRFHKDYANGNGTAQCTWHCYGRAYEVLGKTIEFSGTGGLNGATWYSRITNGEKSNEPKANSIAVWDEGGNGHVAYVEKVDNEYIYISEANWRGTLNAHDDEDGKVYTLPRTNLTRTASGQRTFTFLGFVHLDI